MDDLNQTNGPFSAIEIKNLAKDPDILVWREGLEDWILSSQCPELKVKIYKLKSRPVSSRSSSSGLDEDGQPVTKGFNRANNISKAVNELLGICKTILMDGVVSDEEAVFLKQWCEKQSDLIGEWPLSVLSKRIQ